MGKLTICKNLVEEPTGPNGPGGEAPTVQRNEQDGPETTARKKTDKSIVHDIIRQT